MPKKINWAESFSRIHTIPFGCYVLFEELDKVFNGFGIDISNEPIYNKLQQIDGKGYVFVSINRRFSADAIDIDVLLDFVSMGNVAFIAAESIPEKLSDTLRFKLAREWQSVPFDPQATDKKSWIQNELSLEGFPGQKWVEQRDFNYVHVTPDSTNRITTILGRIDSTRYNFVGIPFGSGTFLVNTSPFMFTNFNLLAEQNHAYISGCFSYLKGSTLIWDEYYKQGRSQSGQSPLATLLKNDSFRLAIYLAILSILVFIFFHAKRRQRIIPVLKPFENTSLDFAQTLGDLYYEQANHEDLAAKKVAYLKDYMHQTFRMKNIAFTSEEISFVANRTGHSEEFIGSLFQMVQRIQRGEKIGAEILDAFNQKLQVFYHRI